MTYPTITKDDLATFSGRNPASYGAYAAQAISQAVLLFKLGTCLANLPEDETLRELAKLGIVSMADNIFLAQRYQEQAAAPFSSESIGSYSYSKSAQAVRKGEDTGVMWFDMAVSQLSVCEADNSNFASGGIEFFDHDGIYVQGSGDNLRFLSPKDMDQSRSFGYDPAPRKSVGPVPGVPSSGDAELPPVV
jgi:hypothetical protein